MIPAIIQIISILILLGQIGAQTLPTSKPTFGPASQNIVDSIFSGVILGIIAILLFYFYTGWILYERDVEARMQVVLDGDNETSSLLATTGSKWDSGENEHSAYNPLHSDKDRNKAQFDSSVGQAFDQNNNYGGNENEGSLLGAVDRPRNTRGGSHSDDYKNNASI